MTTPVEFFPYKKGTLHAENVNLEKIAEKFGTPSFVYSSTAFLHSLNSLRTGLRGLNPLICFSAKSNSNQAILKLLGKNGAGIDVVSGGELYRANAAGIPGSRMVFSGVGKTEDEIQLGLRLGILSFNVESAFELELIKRVAKKQRKIAPISFRFNPNVEADTHPHIQTGTSTAKFGLLQKDLLNLIELGKNEPSLHHIGLSVHIGSQILSAKSFEQAFQRTIHLANIIEEKLNRPLEFIDFGGGLGIPYHLNETTKVVEDYCRMMNRITRKEKIIIEPGRFIAGNSGLLLTRVIAVKQQGRRRFAIVDAAMNDLMRPALYAAFHEIIPVTKSKARSINTDVVGPVCESGDCFGLARKLPSDLAAGQLVAILSAGAYGMSMSSNYNSRPRAAEILITKSRAKLIRKRETWSDLLRNEI